MLQDYAKYKFPDLAKKNVLEFDVNYSGDEEVKDAKIIRWKVGDKVGFIERKHLYEFLWFIGNPEEQRKMIPQTIRHARHYETVVGITATKDIRKGEKIISPISISLPDEFEDIIREIKKPSQLITPKGRI